ncbi:MAG TPA: sigma-70 family RNA polymerase sigma factor [Gemmataceae bacterium]|nr:sigma-70 family RNA polymerase sigma factor [Gemmataceae bacterium]
MADASLNSVLQHVRKLVHSHSTTSLSDGELLHAFVSQRDEAAFSTLVQRHGSMVLKVCRRLLQDEQDAEDAFQATFLVLVRKSAAVRNRSGLGAWLYGVAYRAALSLRRSRLRRRSHERRARCVLPRSPVTELAWREIQALMEEEIQRLPEKYRAVFVLCCLESQTRADVARSLGLKEGTVSSRLDYARNRLHQRLARRGVTLSAVLAATALANVPEAGAVPASLLAATSRAARVLVETKAIAAAAVSAQVAALVQTGLLTTVVTPLGIGFLLVLSLALVVGGTELVVHPIAETPQPGKVQPKTPTPASAEPLGPSVVLTPRTDLYGDPLPKGATARLGTVRLRHGDSVRNVGFLPEAKALLAADWHGVHVWDVDTGRHLRRFGDPRGRQFQDIAFSADGRTVALSFSEGDIEIWDATNCRQLRTLRAGRFPGLALSPDGRTLAVCDHGANVTQQLHLWDTTTGEERHRLSGHAKTVYSFVFAPDGKTLLASGDDNSIRLWDVATGKQMRQFDHQEPLGRLTVSPNGKMLAAVSLKVFRGENSSGWFSSKKVTLWDLNRGKQTHELQRHDPRGVNALAFTPDGHTLVTCDLRSSHWWDVVTGKELAGPGQSFGMVGAMAFGSGGTLLATGGLDQMVRLWDVANNREKLLSGGHRGPVTSVAIAPDGLTFATGGGDHVIRLWDPATGAERRRFEGKGRDFRNLIFTRNGQELISWGSDGVDAVLNYSAHTLDLSTGKEIRRFAGAFALLSADGKVLVTAGEDKTLHVYEAATGNELGHWQLSGAGAYPVSFSPDSQTLVLFGEDKIVRFCDVATGRELRQFAVNPFPADSHGRVYCRAASPDGNLLALGGQLDYLVIYDLTTGKEAKRLTGLPGASSALAFSPNSHLLSSGDWVGGAVRVWEVATGQQFQQFDGHLGRIFSIAFSSDSALLITGSEDTTALVWDLSGRRTEPRSDSVSPQELEARWADLVSKDAVRGQQAVRQFVAVPKQAVPFLKKHLPPTKPLDVGWLKVLIAKLDSDDFAIREQAYADLEELGAAPELFLRKVLSSRPSAEVSQRIEKLLQKVETTFPSQRCRTLRAIQALEQMGTKESRQLLGEFAHGASEALITHEAQAALKRIPSR